MPYSELSEADMPEFHPVSMFAQHWLGRKRPALLPNRSDFGPASIPALVRWLLLLEPMRDGDELEFRYRLAGTGCCEMFGLDFTGKKLGEGMDPEGAEVRHREFMRVMASERPIYSWSTVPIAGREFVRVYRGIFPVTIGGSGVDRIFAVIAPETLRLETRPAIEQKRSLRA